MALIDIGSTKQLFVDDYLIESMTSAAPVLNRAKKVEHNPVLRPERPWEGNDVRVSQVIFDEKDQIFKMWYKARTFSGRQGEDEIVVEGESGGVDCLATSEDGIYWDRPDLGLVAFEGSTDNNILPKQSVKPSFFLDLHEQDPTKRYKAYVGSRATSKPMQLDLFYSPDAFDWRPYEQNPIIDTSPVVGRWGPTFFMGWDPIREIYAVHMENCLHCRCPLAKRLIGRAESPDAINWTAPETIIVPDEKDYPDTEFYAMPAIVYERLYVGLLWSFRTTNTTHYPELVFSRDGIHYKRDYREPFIRQGAPGSFDAVSVYARTPLVHGDRILTYYSGTNWRSPETLIDLGEKATAGIGLAITPLDGFVSLDGAKGVPSDAAPDHPEVAGLSQMVTRAFSFSGQQLFLNVESALQQWGAGPCEVRVEILRPNHAHLPGFGVEEADAITSTDLAHVVSWDGRSDLSRLAGETIKLRFYFKNAKLYAFQFR
jgi:hypothetical protein